MAFERQRDFGHALEEREALARNYTKGTEWYKHNRDNEAAIQTAQDLAELALVSAAVNHHKAAQDLKKLAQAQKKPDPKLVDQIQREYKLAAEAYEKYLEQYPNSRNTYEYSYSYAETLYYSGRFRDAAEAYEKVRDSKLDNKYVEDASFNAVKSYEMALAELQQKGAYTEPPLPAVGQDHSAGDADAGARSRAAPAEGVRPVHDARARLRSRADDDLQGGGDSAALSALGRSASREWSRSSPSTAKTIWAPMPARPF